MLRISIALIVFGVIAVAGVIGIILVRGKTAPYTEIVHITSGPIRGEEVSFEGTKYKAFKGIPYAAPPVGDLRFRDPQPPDNWTSVRDTRVYGKMCHQPKRTWLTSEDCLTLNVFTQSLGERDLKPVLVWIHGGAFSMGDGSDYVYGPQYLIQEDIVVVTLNYRLGPLGFLSTNTPDASGNWGLKDQTFALRWVQENIVKFGGDPNQVTIYGESAGGASVHFHLFSSLSKGLFHKAIAASGVATNGWAVKRPDAMEVYSKNMARILGASESQIQDPARRIQFLRTADSKAMTERAHEVVNEEDMESPMTLTVVFVPTIEPPTTQGAFLTEDPRKLLAEGRYTDVPLIMGVNDLEGGLVYAGHRDNLTAEALQKIEENVCQILPDSLRNAVTAKKECPKVAQEMRNAYFDGKPFNSSLLNFLYLSGDILMVQEIHYAQRKHALNSNPDTPIYNYYFTFDGQWNFNKILANITLPGAIHADDLSYVFKPTVVSLPNLPPTAPEVITKNRMVRFIANFVKYGNPTPSVSDLIPVKWEPARANISTTMVINNDLKLENEFLKTRMDMWDRLYDEYNGPSLF